jgi:HCOMODA/2-hydroxy-3-carboxy-muconic semialdehyde decarboxylase
VAEAARLLAAAGLVEAFGHVSARLEGADLLITSTAPLGAQTADDVAAPDVPERPLETPLHAAVYAARPDVGAVCRTHSRHAVAFGARGEVPALVHGLGGLAGSIVTHGERDLITDGARAALAAEALGSADVLLLRGNGAVCTGPDLPTACVRAFFLEERARVAFEAGPTTVAFTDSQVRARTRHHSAETARAWRWLVWRFPGADPPPANLQGGGQ